MKEKTNFVKMQPRNVRIKKPHGAPTLPPLLLGGSVISRFGVATVEMEMSAGDMQTL